MQEQMNQSNVEWKIWEDVAHRETQIRKFVGGIMTTQISHRYQWSKRGRQGCWVKAMRQIEGKSSNIG